MLHPFVQLEERRDHVIGLRLAQYAKKRFGNQLVRNFLDPLHFYQKPGDRILNRCLRILLEYFLPHFLKNKRFFPQKRLHRLHLPYYVRWLYYTIM
ncbi:hypothetical protein D3C73_1391790 [compost metagenome]